MNRTAVIDIGTNTLLLLVCEPDGSGGLRSVASGGCVPHGWRGRDCG